MARMAAFWSLAVLLFYGCTSLHATLSSSFTSLGKPLVSGIERVPILGLRPSAALLISVLVLCAGLLLLSRWQERPKTADLLIDTEHELRKVTWPSLDEAINGSVVVMVAVLFLMAFLAGTDYVLGELARRILIG